MEPNVTTTETLADDNRPLFGATENLLSLPFANPFVGLRPFKTEESQLFFGRDEQIIELLSQLHRTRFLAVVGSSGCGKSSLIRAGLIPKLKAGFLVEDRDLWLTATMKPGDAPLRNLAAALLEAAFDDVTEPMIDSFVKHISQMGAEYITTRLAPALGDSSSNLLLLIDQFEEIFRFGVESNDAEKREEAEDFIALMLVLAEQKQLAIYVVLTMRSDFLGDCDNFYGLPEAMNRSQYLVPRPTRQQRQQAIEGPIRLFGAQITPRLLDRVLNDVGDKSDQLSVMQHALMRTWEWWQSENAKGGAPQVDLPHYEAAGGVKEALSLDAEAALNGMNDDELKITERMFQALTDTDTRNRRVRRPAHLSKIMAITGASREQILKNTEWFRGEGLSFLTLTNDADPLIDISHESLILWDFVSELMKVTRLRTDRPCSLLEAAQHSNRLFMHSLNRYEIRLEIKVDSKLMVDVPFHVASLAIANLVSNAIDALRTRSGGVIKIEAWDMGEMIHCCITDNGVGIDPDVRERLFEIGATTKPGSGGWGLYLVKRSLVENRGHLELLSTGDDGTKFLIRFPNPDYETKRPLPSPC